MPYDEQIAARLRAAVADLPLDPAEQISEKKMFSGLSFLLNGHILVGVSPNGLLMRFADPDLDSVLALPDARHMERNGRPSKNFVFVDPAAIIGDAALDELLEKSLRYVREWQQEAKAKPRKKRT